LLLIELEVHKDGLIFKNFHLINIQLIFVK
ncbi:MAG: hypothetical protein RLZZ557_535, partial [Bacteroidota bacterium]